MSGSVNKAIIIGNLGADPKMMRTQDGKLIATLSVATSRSWKDKHSGERRERTEWHRVVIFTEGLAKIAEQYLRKGSKVYVEGQVQTPCHPSIYRKWFDIEMHSVIQACLHHQRRIDSVQDSFEFSSVHKVIEDDFKERMPGYHKSRREGLTVLAGVVLNTRSANLMEFAAALPRDIGSVDHRYQYVSRVLGNSHIDCDEVMRAYATEVFARLASQGQTIVLMLDQSHVNDDHEVLMVSVRMRDRALPVAWRVRKTKGAIGFHVQKDLLDAILDWPPAGTKVVVMGDRFYGTAKLVAWCQAAGWGYRLRMKGNVTLQHEGGELKSGEILTLMPQGLIDAEFHGSGIRSNIGVLHEAGHPEPWIIAMDAVPGQYTTLDYGMRWGIEAMFSDFKSRGFGICQSQITRTDRVERLILVMAIAMYWAVSTGAAEEKQAAQSGRKRGFARRCVPCARSSRQGCAAYEDTSPGTAKSQNYGTSGYIEGW